MGIRDVNDPRNLVPSCAKCNSHKSAKMGLWIARGKIGQLTWLWMIRKISRLMIVVIALYILYSNGIILEIIKVIQTNAHL